MAEPWYLAATVAIAAAVTWGLRAAPFAVRAVLRDSPVVHYLSRTMPLGVMVILAVYTMRSATTATLLELAPFAAAVGVGLHLWRRNALVSILVGTCVHVALATALA